jgi:predicted MFS family arabinose efflux permease
MATTALATIAWGICGWAMVIPQQHRLISISSATAPLLLALNSTALYVGVALSGLLGGIGLRILGRYQLGFMSALLILLGLLLAELADFTMRRRTAIQTC